MRLFPEFDEYNPESVKIICRSPRDYERSLIGSEEMLRARASYDFLINEMIPRAKKLK